MVTPKNVRNSEFIGSPFGNAQLEMMLSCIVITQFRMNPDAWTPFTWEEYRAKCDHTPRDIEREILEAMVNGGKILFEGGSRYRKVEGGYLTKDNDGRYTITQKLLQVMAPYAK